jgi:hypothetical protein
MKSYAPLNRVAIAQVKVRQEIKLLFFVLIQSFELDE